MFILSLGKARIFEHVDVMDRWTGVLKVPLYPNGRAFYQVAASLCLSPTSKNLTVPSSNAIFFSGDRVAHTGNPVIERLSGLQTIAEILVSKIGGSINTWVIEASVYNGPFAVYKDFIPSVNQWGEPKSYNPVGFPASRSAITLLSNFLEELKSVNSWIQQEPLSASTAASKIYMPKTLIFGFSKGGTVVNQLIAELGFSEEQPEHREYSESKKEFQIIPSTKESLLNSISEVHYIDVGLNSAGAYITDHEVIEKISRIVVQENREIRFVLHGTPRQWCDSRRSWIRDEKDKLLHVLESEAGRSGGKLQVSERFYFGDCTPNLQMHFEIIEKLDVS
ncbi:uncharacterized protein LOC107435145 isoform X1 [Ziziphus jujuba]|uniref:Uncharacterized protein LOC107435145 isoform X1 n=2 Tax=Ziziphus jujuba TaxID=326968 RepID=A0ABM4AEI5_ZIZJJ|nr:uncharacterized protein LOC107435145 isoform X1 [Ziziphus jujuba]XP_060675149.1 uncharacterized protein LOC107435145 isoform X1 [Ziziphus jujuba]XP_060675150.1 uncharacterized protein LOC107435145 isoform X1 [Ziziphus jujuba]